MHCVGSSSIHALPNYNTFVNPDKSETFVRRNKFINERIASNSFLQNSVLSRDDHEDTEFAIVNVEAMNFYRCSLPSRLYFLGSIFPNDLLSRDVIWKSIHYVFVSLKNYSLRFNFRQNHID